MKNKLTCCITGGLGFIGSHLAEKIPGCTIIDDLSSGRLDNLKDKTNFKKIDLLDYNEKFDLVIHLAADIDARDDNIETFYKNLKLTEKAISLTKDRIIFASSAAVYGDVLKAKETDALYPFKKYGYYKYLSEELIKSRCKNYTIFRFGNVFGERQKEGLIAKLKRKENIDVYNLGKGQRDYIYVADIVDAIVNYQDNGIFNLGTGENVNTLDIVKSAKVKYKMIEAFKEIIFSSLDSKKMRDKGWKTTLTAKEYLKENYVDGYKKWKKTNK